MASQIEKETLALAIVGSATEPTGISGHSGPPYFTKIASKFMKFHTRSSRVQELVGIEILDVNNDSIIIFE